MRCVRGEPGELSDPVDSVVTYRVRVVSVPTLWSEVSVVSVVSVVSCPTLWTQW